MEGPKCRNKSNKWPNEGSQFAKALKEPKTLFRMNEKEANSALMECILIKSKISCPISILLLGDKRTSVTMDVPGRACVNPPISTISDQVHLCHYHYKILFHKIGLIFSLIAFPKFSSRHSFPQWPFCLQIKHSTSFVLAISLWGLRVLF